MLNFFSISPLQLHEPTALERKQPLPPVGPQVPQIRRDNPRTTDYTRAAFRAGQVIREQVFAQYREKPVQHRGPDIAHNPTEFNAAIDSAKNDMPPTEHYESMIATLGPALDALTEGRHPKIDWTQPVVMPPDHPKFSQIAVLQAQMQLGFGEEKRDFNNNVETAIEEASNKTENTATPSVLKAADKFARTMYNISDSDDGHSDEEPRK